MDTTLIAIIVAAFVIAGTIKGAFGIGLPTTSITIPGTNLVYKKLL